MWRFIFHSVISLVGLSMHANLKKQSTYSLLKGFIILNLNHRPGMCTHTCLLKHLYICTHMLLRMHFYVNMQLYVCICTYAFIPAYACISLHVHTHSHPWSCKRVLIPLRGAILFPPWHLGPRANVHIDIIVK